MNMKQYTTILISILLLLGSSQVLAGYKTSASIDFASEDLKSKKIVSKVSEEKLNQDEFPLETDQIKYDIDEKSTNKSPIDIDALAIQKTPSFNLGEIKPNAFVPSWTDLSIAGPPARRLQAMAYSPIDDKTVLFGGIGVTTYIGDTWIFDHSTNTWTEVFPTLSPGVRGHHRMEYDYNIDKIILFGGTDSFGAKGDVWTYDIGTNVWTEKTVTNGPSARMSPGMIYDRNTRSILLFGGRSGSTYFSDTWRYFPSSNYWSLQSTTGTPSARYLPAMVYDSKSSRTVLFGGSNGGAIGDTWTYYYDSNTWVQVFPTLSPSARYGSAAEYDPMNDRVILFSGISESTDTWSFDANTNTWELLATNSNPSSRMSNELIYDDVAQKFMIFGGWSTSSPLADTWQLSAFPIVTSYGTFISKVGNPSSASVMAYDPTNDKTVSFGNGGGANSDQTWIYDHATNSWTQVFPTLTPTFREAPAFGYDPVSNKFIMWGGLSSSYFGGVGYLTDSWTYDLASNTWSQIFPVSTPSARYRTIFDYNKDTQTFILYGGSSGSTETWEYNPSTNVWTQKFPTSNPGGIISQDMAYDSNYQKFVLYKNGQTWLYDQPANTWTKVFPSVSPSVRNYGGMAFDSNNNKIIMFGGTIFATSKETSEVWSYDVGDNIWAQLNPGNVPPPRSGIATTFVYNNLEQTFLIQSGVYGGVRLSDTWELTLFPRTNFYNQLNVAGPSARYYSSMVYDSINHVTVLFGGYTGSVDLGDTWIFNHGTNSWSQVFPAQSPSVRYGHEMVYDPVNQQIILFGGRSLGVARNDLWVYSVSLNTWTEKTPSVSPSSRYYFALGYNIDEQTILLFGGFGGSGSYLSDTWEYNPVTNTWISLSPTGSPSARDGVRLAYDHNNKKFVMYGGWDATPLGGTYIYDPATNAWTVPNPSNSPGPKAWYGFSYNPFQNKIILQGGYPTNNLVWEYSIGVNNWIQIETDASMPSRYANGFSFNSKDQLYLLFGGLSSFALGSTYELKIRLFVEDQQSLVISSASDINYELGITGNSLSWIGTDDMPFTYFVDVDSIPLTSSTWTSGLSIDVNVDGLNIGAHIVEITLTDYRGNSITDTVTVTVLPDTTNPVITNAALDITYEEGTTSNTLSWTATDLHSGTYSIVINSGTPSSPVSWSSGSPAIVNVDGLALGVNSVEITFSDVTGNTAIDTANVNVIDTVNPIISTPLDITYNEGTTGNTITWTATDAHPGTFLVKQDGVIINADISWTSGVPFSFNIDGLTLGTYSFTVEISDTSANGISDSVIVTVVDTTPPALNSLADITYNEGTTGNSLTYSASDNNPGTYSVFIDGVQKGSAITWASGVPFPINVDGLSLGSYTFKVEVSDSLGNMVSDTVIITVVDANSPVVDSPSDIIYEEGSTGNSITWIATDDNPTTYIILKDGVQLGTATIWTSGAPISIGIDGLIIGSHTYVIEVSDSSGNTISDTVLVTVVDTLAPTINSPADLSYEEGSLGNSISWIANDVHPGTYVVIIDEDAINTPTSWASGVVITVDIDDLSIGFHTIVIDVSDGSGNEVSDTVLVIVVDTVSPTIDSPTDLSYEEGSLGNSISWIANDAHPGTYLVIIDGAAISTPTSWASGVAITVDIDGLSVGLHTIIIELSDTSGNDISDTVTVTVVDTISPIIDSPTDLSYEEGTTGNSITWIATDTNQGSYIVKLDGVVFYSSASWVSGVAITINIDGLTVGTYTYTIEVYDAYLNMNTDVVRLTVTAATTDSQISSSSEDTISSSGTDGGGGGKSFLPFPFFEVILSLFALPVGIRLRSRKR